MRKFNLTYRMENNLQGRREVKKETLLREPDVISSVEDNTRLLHGNPSRIHLRRNEGLIIVGGNVIAN